jgi:hypothetical protein
MRSFTAGLYIAFAASSVGSLGCSAAVPEDEPVSELREAIDISNWNGLVNMGSTGSYRLTANIDAIGRTWTPKNFSGTFDGGNFTISNLSINSGGFFAHLSNATIRNVRLTSMTLTGSSLGGLGALASSEEDTSVENCAVEANINVAGFSVGGMFGSMTGGSIFRSYAKGTITGSILYAGGLAGIANDSSIGLATISESYAQVTVNPNTPSGSTVIAGGLIGYGAEPDIHDVYAVGNVTGRGAVGGMVGALDCIPDYTVFFLYKTIHRGDVIDRNWTPSGGWSGPVGTFVDCTGRMEQNFYDRTLDPSSNRANHHSIQGFTSTELRSPTTVIGGVFCQPDIIPERCGDATWTSPPWTAGSNTQHHVLMNMPGPNAQPR